jgi:hypothetical protein
MGFARSPAPHVVKSAEIISFAREREIASAFHAVDPFGIDDHCEFGPRSEHFAIGSCGDVVCCYCARIFWS